jgi:hypothetical protein
MWFFQAPEPLLPNFGGGSALKHMGDIVMLSGMNARERLHEEFVSIA